jgi:hypothetical protein
MINKNFMEKPLTWLLPRLLRLDIYLFRSQETPKHNSNIFKVYYFGTILLLSFLWYSTIVSIEGYFERTSFSIFYGLGIIVTLGTYFLIYNKVKIPLDDEFIIKPSILKKREQKHKSLGLNFSKTHLREIYNFLIDVEFINKKSTSFGAFNAVFSKDFGHNQYVVLNLKLANIRCLFEVFEDCSKGFISIAIQKGLFLNKNFEKINPVSYRNAKRTKEAKEEALDPDFMDFLSSIEQLKKIIS